MATPGATRAYRNRFHEVFARTYFRRFGDCFASSIGVGTYLGAATDAADERYHEAITEVLENGVNVVDTAINYRRGRSERVVGDAIDGAETDRDAVVVSTKGGFVPDPPDGDDSNRNPIEWLRTEIDDLDPEMVVGQHCIAPEFIDWSLDRSLSNLGLEAIDLYYLHNPIAQCRAIDRATLYDRIEDAFTRLEERTEAGDIDSYGIATWACLRVPPDHEKHLSLPEVVSRARRASDRAGTTATSFRAIQLPFNIHMADGFSIPAHDTPEGRVSALRFAQQAGLDVFTSASILQGDLARQGSIPDAVAERLSGDTAAQRAINFARSAPGVTTALVGTGSPEHVAENIAAGTFSPMGADAFDSIFE